MTQATYTPDVTDTDGDAFSFFTNVLLAIATMNSGLSEPTQTFAHMPWYDAATDCLKLRNAADDGWIEFARFDQVNGVVLLAPLSQSSSGVGQRVTLAPGVGAGLQLPADGTWEYSAYKFNSGITTSSAHGIAPGGTVLDAGTGGQNWDGWAKRIS